MRIVMCERSGARLMVGFSSFWATGGRVTTNLMRLFVYISPVDPYVRIKPTARTERWPHSYLPHDHNGAKCVAVKWATARIQWHDYYLSLACRSGIIYNFNRYYYIRTPISRRALWTRASIDYEFYWVGDQRLRTRQSTFLSVLATGSNVTPT